MLTYNITQTPLETIDKLLTITFIIKTIEVQAQIIVLIRNKSDYTELVNLINGDVDEISLFSNIDIYCSANTLDLRISISENMLTFNLGGGMVYETIIQYKNIICEMLTLNKLVNDLSKYF